VKRTLLVSLVLAALMTVVVPVTAGAGGSDHGSLYNNRLEVGRALIEVQSTNWQSILPYYTYDIEYHDPIVDIYGFGTMAEFLGRLFGSSPDLVTTIEDESLDDGTYSASWTMVGQFAGVPYEAKGISIIKFRDDTAMVYYQRDYYSENDIMINIPGLDQAVIGFRTFYRCAVDPTFECPLGGPTRLARSDVEPAIDAQGAYDGEANERGLDRLRQRQMEIGRSLVEINPTNWQSLLRYYANNIEYHDPIVDIYGIDTMTEFLGRLFGSSPNLVTTIEDESLTRGMYTATWTMSGEFEGSTFSAKGMSLVRFHGWSTRVYYSRDYYTEGDIMAGIPGLDEAIQGFRIFYRCAVDPTFDCPLEGQALAGLGGEQTRQDGMATAGFGLQQNIPNPFNPVTEIAFQVPEGGADVSLRIYNAAGRLVRTLADGYEPGGSRTLSWDGTNDAGHDVASGMYIYQLSAPTFAETKKMLLLK